jgi:hypothetical protein
MNWKFGLRSQAVMISAILRKIALLILLGSASMCVQGQHGAEKPPIDLNNVQPIKIGGDKALCDGYGVASNVSSKEGWSTSFAKLFSLS